MDKTMIRSKPHAVKHPMQPIVYSKDKVIRFKENVIVSFLLNSGPNDMNKLAMMNFSKDDWTQFYQLIGYSVSGFGDLSRVDKKIVIEADKIAEKLYRKRHGK